VLFASQQPPSDAFDTNADAKAPESRSASPVIDHSIEKIGIVFLSVFIDVQEFFLCITFFAYLLSDHTPIISIICSFLISRTISHFHC
jgi:hypothetical protein